MKIEWIAPPPDLRPLVHTFYLIDSGSDIIDEPTPAYSAQLVLFLQGSVDLEYENDEIVFGETLLLSAPRLVAGRVRITDRIRAAGASLTPLGWAALTGFPVNKVHDCSIAPETFASPELIKRIEAWRTAGETRPDALRDGRQFLESLLQGAKHPISRRHREFVERFNEWLASDLNPPLSDLYKQLPLGERQIQRLSRQFFGAPPSQVAMRHRAIRIAMLLSNPDLPQAMRDELISTYFDQAHMIRSIRRFTGRTPANLASPSLAKVTLDPKGHGDTAEMLREPPQATDN